jgi:hypothetical protein
VEQYVDDYPAHDTPYYTPHPDDDNQHPYLARTRTAPYPMLHKDPSFLSEISEHTATDRESDMPLAIPHGKPEEEQRGFWRNLLPSSMACRLYLLVVLLETIVDVAIEADIDFLLHHIPPNTDSDLKYSRLPVYLGVFTFAHLFQLGMALDAVHARNTLQFLFLTIFNFLLMVYAIIQKTELLESVPKGQTGVTHIPVDVLTTIIAVVIAVAEILFIGLGWKIYTEFGWQVYKRLGADRSVKKMYMHFQIFVCLVKFDVFFWIGFSVQWIFLVLKQNTAPAEYYITIAALPVSLLLLVVGHMAAKHERTWLMSIFMSGCVAACVYFVYKLYKILRFKDDAGLRPVFKTLTVFSSLAVVLLLITFVWSCIVMSNFDKGLKTRVAKHEKGAASVHLSRNPTVRPSHFEMGASTHERRLSID